MVVFTRLSHIAKEALGQVLNYLICQHVCDFFFFVTPGSIFPSSEFCNITFLPLLYFVIEHSSEWHHRQQVTSSRSFRHIPSTELPRNTCCWRSFLYQWRFNRPKNILTSFALLHAGCPDTPENLCDNLQLEIWVIEGWMWESAILGRSNKVAAISWPSV